MSCIYKTGCDRGYGRKGCLNDPKGWIKIGRNLQIVQNCKKLVFTKARDGEFLKSVRK